MAITIEEWRQLKYRKAVVQILKTQLDTGSKEEITAERLERWIAARQGRK